MHSQVNELAKFPLSHGLALKVLSCKAGWKMVSAKSSKIRSEKNVCLPMIPRSNLYQILRGGRASLKNMPYSQEESGTLKTSLISENFCLVCFKLSCWRWILSYVHGNGVAGCARTGRAGVRCLWSICTAVGLFIKWGEGDDQSRCNYSFRSRAYSMAYWHWQASCSRRKKEKEVKKQYYRKHSRNRS